MPTVLVLFGMRFYYCSHEHEPIHIHVKKGNAEEHFAIKPQVELAIAGKTDDGRSRIGEIKIKKALLQ